MTFTGYQNSWNAKYCCGRALTQNINDYHFLQQLIEHLHTSHDFIHKDVVYGIGWSNGGYMVTYAAQLFRTVVPISGYQYHLEDINFRHFDNQKEEQKEDEDKGQKGEIDIASMATTTTTATNEYLFTGLFQHHSLNDPIVQYEGCCKDGSCCCGIYTDQCVSAESSFREWGKRINQCEMNRNKYSYDDSSSSTTTTTTTTTRGIKCQTMMNCHTNTTLCTYEKEGHFRNFPTAFPMYEEVGHFISRDLCSLSQSIWRTNEKKCSCNDGDSNYDDNDHRMFCLQLSKDDRSLFDLRKHRPSIPQQQQHHTMDEIHVVQDNIGMDDYKYDNEVMMYGPITLFGINIMISVGIIVVGLIVLILYRKRIQSSRKRGKGWEQVAMNDDKEIELSSAL